MASRQRRGMNKQGSGILAYGQQDAEEVANYVSENSQINGTAAAAAKRRARLRRRSSSSLSAAGKMPAVPSLIPQRQVAVPKQETDPNTYGIHLERTEATFLGGLMGMASRSEITGHVSLRGGVLNTESDFAIADFWSRETISGLPSELAKDHYLFRILPLTYRTWMYHYAYNTGMMHRKASKARETFEDVDDMFGHVLEQSCIDVAATGGRWSPAMCYVPATMFAVMTASVSYVIGIAAVFVFIIAASRLMNTPHLYRYLRVTTLPLRLGFLLITLLEALQEKDAVKLLGFVLISVCLLIDFLAGDIGQIIDFKHTCTYEVVRSLANRVYVCKRIGAGYTKEYMERPFVDEFVSGVGNWDHTYVILCDLMGIVVELQPMQLEDWVQVMDSAKSALDPVNFISLNVYNDECPSAYSLGGGDEKDGNEPNTPQKPPPMPALPHSLPPELPGVS
mmetsp:Transcript_29776/g.69260  ORF Transcript_29776/g.69260 Transcript_29776/m.69260 type:complete len:452 (-) Transcript_29776:215-1570(-)|eukprot:CAMPEP_0178407010 /NCGR_PEP_ID=MMETSP0689_2-20121128/19208_1 /TAXON_ID=160604 /ORGANISM="Amphidinium massartii, Strain CS-259" /LENGTH=451 /DNA_ID=CAMNT_0020028071 /DNA_START=140 /DNA_END=1495 /DNA_ORIENTATION=-